MCTRCHKKNHPGCHRPLITDFGHFTTFLFTTTATQPSLVDISPLLYLWPPPPPRPPLVLYKITRRTVILYQFSTSGPAFGCANLPIFQGEKSCIFVTPFLSVIVAETRIISKNVVKQQLVPIPCSNSSRHRHASVPSAPNLCGRLFPPIVSVVPVPGPQEVSDCWVGSSAELPSKKAGQEGHYKEEQCQGKVEICPTFAERLESDHDHTWCTQSAQDAAWCERRSPLLDGHPRRIMGCRDDSRQHQHNNIYQQQDG
jgi:hypothetical protein